MERLLVMLSFKYSHMGLLMEFLTKFNWGIQEIFVKMVSNINTIC